LSARPGIEEAGGGRLNCRQQGSPRYDRVARTHRHPSQKTGYRR
jgi:hypothetical protein